MKIRAYAKINLYLKVFKNNKKINMHKIKSHFYRVDDFFDEIEIKRSDKTSITFNNIKIDETENSVYKTVVFLRNQLGISKNYKITVNKIIPVGSGMGGGSSDAISVAKYILNDNKIQNQEKYLNQIASIIGSDCYFFIKDCKEAIISGYGNKVKIIKSNIVLVKEDILIPKNISCLTKDVYNKFDEIEGWKNKKEINMLEIPAKLMYPKLNDIDSDFIMTGSGCAFFKNKYKQ